jgi:hypothetical protein
MRIAPGDLEPLRRERIKTGIQKKKAKLLHHKNQSARTILGLENNDMVLTNHVLVGECLAELLSARPCWLDELFFLYTTTSIWTIYQWSWDTGQWDDHFSEFNPADLNNLFK